MGIKSVDSRSQFSSPLPPLYEKLTKLKGYDKDDNFLVPLLYDDIQLWSRG